MGYYGYQIGPAQSISKKYAWFPVKTNSRKWVWFDDYYVILIYYDENGKPPIKGLNWTLVLNKKEYLIWCIKNPIIETKLSFNRRPAYYLKKF